MRISYCSSDVCSSDLARQRFLHLDQADVAVAADHQLRGRDVGKVRGADREAAAGADDEGVAGAVVGKAIGVDAAGARRSGERRVGEEWSMAGRYRWAASQSKKKTQEE